MSGWIKLHRKIFENPFYFSEKFTRCQAWIDLLLLANFKDGFFYKRGIKVEVSRGQIGYDLDSLANRWTWSRGKVERFIIDLENENQVVRQKNNITTLITVINYNIYQIDDNTDSNTNNNTDGQQTINQTVTQTETNKKVKKDKKVKEFIVPSQTEVENYFKENGFDRELAKKFFDGYSVNDWKDSNGKKLNNWKQKAIQVWFKDKDKKTIIDGKKSVSDMTPDEIVKMQQETYDNFFNV